MYNKQKNCIFVIKIIMDKYIKYKRIVETVHDNHEEIQKFLDKLITDGWEIINYNETCRSEIASGETTICNFVSYLDIVAIVGKRQNNIL